MDAGGVGDICTRYFDRYGNFIDTPFYNRIISIRVDQIRRTEHVIAVGSGAEKSRALAALLKSHILTELFVDEDLARAIITELR